MPTDKSDARERAREVLAQISERDGHLGAAKQLRDPAFELNKEDGSKTAIDAMLAFATPLPEAVPAADLEREAASCPKCSNGKLRLKLRCDECATVFTEGTRAFRDAGRGTDGFVLVPREPTEAMLREGASAVGDERVDGYDGDVRALWSAMLAAAEAPHA